MTRTAVIIAVSLAACLAGCASKAATAPAWFQTREATVADTYPSLRSVPHGNIAETNPAHWAAVQADVVAAGAALKANPRAEPAPAQDPNAFINDARAALDATRQSHN